ncbi:lasso RiPP family leader peptide-containing protein [Streptomyces litchfieldiae]|uniref:Lasso RiPP family leader peptide-containing protein n=1 Tax=Streptomyces litchfieldiae TaxID=3075543 RepID=A0ABU2MRU9_9ACTN|nr:lasso RiPP family leader peptide-containing protein [Streptomyces sp. DSM 44938]MDT0344235.1 lasso RiPP family leader peptide-containing protein [Streptomyces sp. DSM 44938]
MYEEPSAEEPEVYEPPVLMEVGGFAEETQGQWGWRWSEGPGRGYYGT